MIINNGNGQSIIDILMPSHKCFFDSLQFFSMGLDISTWHHLTFGHRRQWGAACRLVPSALNTCHLRSPMHRSLSNMALSHLAVSNKAQMSPPTSISEKQADEQYSN